MRSIRDAIMTATREALGQYLAPDLVEQLSDEIITRAAPEMEEALRAMAGFDLSRPSPRKIKPNAAEGKPSKRGRPAKEPEPTGVPMYSTGVGRNDNGNGAEPAVAPMDMI